MTHVVTENCIKRKYMDCVTVFHWRVEDLGICQARRLDERLSRAWLRGRCRPRSCVGISDKPERLLAVRRRSAWVSLDRNRPVGGVDRLSRVA